MSDLILPGDPPVSVTLRRSARARRLSLRVSRLNGTVTLTCPPFVAEKDAFQFATEKEGWLRKHLRARPEHVVVDRGTEIVIEGQAVTIDVGPRARVRRDGATLWVAAGPPVGAQVAGYLKSLARDRLVAASDQYAAQLGRPYARLALRDTRSRWGSCSSRGTLSYSWRLIMAPPDVLSYVAAHEVCHLQEMNHSPAYWELVARLWPGYEVPRRWLRTEGERLHRYRFESQD